MLVLRVPHSPLPDPTRPQGPRQMLPLTLSPRCSLPGGGLVPPGRRWPSSQDSWPLGHMTKHCISPAVELEAAGQQGLLSSPADSTLSRTALLP